MKEVEMFVLLGEVHGVRENVSVIKKLLGAYIKARQPVVLGLEWPHELSTEIDEYITRRRRKLMWQKWEFVEYQDGRISRHHLELLTWMRENNKKHEGEFLIRLFCFDVERKDWNTRDRLMAKIVVDMHKQFPARIMLAVMGKMHARKRVFVDGGKRHIPLAMHLRKLHPISIILRYLSGEFFNLQRQKFQSAKTDNKSRLFIEGITKESAFDREIVIPQAHAVALLKQAPRVEGSPAEVGEKTQ
jgi:hypothetical protein